VNEIYDVTTASLAQNDEFIRKPLKSTASKCWLQLIDKVQICVYLQCEFKRSYFFATCRIKWTRGPGQSRDREAP